MSVGGTKRVRASVLTIFDTIITLFIPGMYCWADWRREPKSCAIGGTHLIIPIINCTCSRPPLRKKCVNVHFTVQHGLMQAPVDTQAVLLLLHASFTLAAVQRSGQQCRHGVLTLVARSGPELHAPVPRHALPEGAQTWAAGVIAGAGVSGAQAVPPACRQSHAWDSCKTRRTKGELVSCCGPPWWALSGETALLIICISVKLAEALAEY